MKRIAFVLGVSLACLPAQADITHKIQSSIQLSVDGAASVATRIPSTYSVSGSNISLDTVGGLGSHTAGSAVSYTPATYSVSNAGESFSYSESFIEGDDHQSATDVTSGVVTALPNFGSVTTTAGGVAGNLGGSIDSGGSLSITAGGAGTSAIGQVIQELTVK